VNQAVPHNLVKQPQRWPLVGLLLLFLLLTACFGGGAAEEAAPETALVSTATLRCTETCAAQGQCGTTADGRIVILSRSASAGFRDHDVLLANDSVVTVLAQQPYTIQDITGVQSSLNFFVIQPEGGNTSWVAGSCVEPIVQQ
jgi:hypothetical protein